MPSNLQLNQKISYNPQKIGTNLFKKFQLCSLARHYDIYFAKSGSNLHFLNNLKNRLPDQLRSWEAVQTFKIIVFPTKMSHKSQCWKMAELQNFEIWRFQTYYNNIQYIILDQNQKGWLLMKGRTYQLFALKKNDIKIYRGDNFLTPTAHPSIYFVFAFTFCFGETFDFVCVYWGESYVYIKKLSPL